jgi:hypothetical protein
MVLLQITEGLLALGLELVIRQPEVSVQRRCSVGTSFGVIARPPALR